MSISTPTETLQTAYSVKYGINCDFLLTHVHLLIYPQCITVRKLFFFWGSGTGGIDAGMTQANCVRTSRGSGTFSKLGRHASSSLPSPSLFPFPTLSPYSFPLPYSFLPSPPFPSPFLPSPSTSYRCKLPSGPGQIPAEKQIWCIFLFEVKMTHLGSNLTGFEMSGDEILLFYATEIEEI